MRIVEVSERVVGPTGVEVVTEEFSMWPDEVDAFEASLPGNQWISDEWDV